MLATKSEQEIFDGYIFFSIRLLRLEIGEPSIRSLEFWVALVLSTN